MSSSLFTRVFTKKEMFYFFWKYFGIENIFLFNKFSDILFLEKEKKPNDFKIKTKTVAIEFFSGSTYDTKNENLNAIKILCETKKLAIN